MRLRDRSTPSGPEAVDDGARQATAREDHAVLEVRHVSVDYGCGSDAVHAVTDVSFTLDRGEILGLAGESGCGKSTLAYAIARLLRPPAQVVRGEVFYWPIRDPGSEARERSSDPVRVFELSMSELQAFRWRRLAIVFQSAMNALNPVMDIGAQITDVLRAHDPAMSSTRRQERAAELLRLVGIAPDRLRSFPHELSGGMRQRAIIAIALALNPELIIMDEPTTALDVVVQREILAEIASLRQRLGFSVIFITHDLSLLLEIADRVAIMYAGRIVEMASAAEVYSRPRHPYTYGLLHSFPKVQGPRMPLNGIPGAPPDLRALPAGCAFRARCPHAFDACREYFPSLLPSAESTGGSVACHMFDDHFRCSTIPDRVSDSCDLAFIQPDDASPNGETR
jgi:peptide/nickel transport system ATP-binding protein